MSDWDYTIDDLKEGLKSVGIKQGDIIFTYVSFGLLGRLKDSKSSGETCQILFDSFRKILGSEGTLLVPTYTYSFPNKEIYDVQNSPSTIGPFTEFFRKQKGVIRSRDPIFSVAGLGPKATYLLSNLPKTCFGKESVYDKLTKLGGKICMIGLSLHWSTYRHHIEEIVGIPARYSKKFSGQIIENENTNLETWNYYARKLKNYCLPDGRRLDKKAREMGACKTKRLGRGEILLIECRKYFELGKMLLKKDPWFTSKGPKP